MDETFSGLEDWVSTFSCPHCGVTGDLPEPMPPDIAERWECPDCTEQGVVRHREQIAREDRKKRLQRRKLAEKRRKIRGLHGVLRRARLSGYSYSEIAETLGISAESVITLTRKDHCKVKGCEHWESVAGLCPWHFYDQWEQTGTCPL